MNDQNIYDNVIEKEEKTTVSNPYSVKEENLEDTIEGKGTIKNLQQNTNDLKPSV